MFRIEMLPAAHGDALWIEYGKETKPRRILIDAGPINVYDAVQKRLKSATSRRADVDLFVITHIDTDHIDGAVMLLQDESLQLEFADIWFNAWQQLAPETVADTYGPEQGEFVAALVKMDDRPWNRAFQGRAVAIPETGLLPVVNLPEGVKLTLLSPGDRQLRRLRRNWDSVIADAGWDPGNPQAALKRLRERREYQPSGRSDTFATEDFGTDNAVANGSSIAFVMEHDGIRCLLTGDAFDDVLAASLDRYAVQNTLSLPIKFDAVKLPHHGSMKNWSSELQKRVTSHRYLISTSGARFQHPDAETIDLILKEDGVGKIELWFNYKSDTTRRWADSARRRSSGFTAHYAATDQSAIVTLK